MGEVKSNMIVRESGKVYELDDETGRVVSVTEEEEVIESAAEDFKIGSRVEVEGELGEVVTLVSSWAGVAYGVRFDDGSLDEFQEHQLKLSSVEEKPDYDSPVAEVLDRFSSYQESPQYTNEEITEKEREARWLNLRARSLVTDSKLALSQQNDLGRVVIVTGNDLSELKELRSRSEDSETYLSSLSRYALSKEVNGYGASLGMKGDTSWLDMGAEGMEVVETTDSDLAARATEVVAALSREQLEDDEFMRVASSYQQEYLQMTEEQVAKFDSYLAAAKKDRLKNLGEAKTASTEEENLDDFDTTQLFL
jgi:hypothetical protein